MTTINIVGIDPLNTADIGNNINVTLNDTLIVEDSIKYDIETKLYKYNGNINELEIDSKGRIHKVFTGHSDYLIDTLFHFNDDDNNVLSITGREYYNIIGDNKTIKTNISGSDIVLTSLETKINNANEFLLKIENNKISFYDTITSTWLTDIKLYKGITYKFLQSKDDMKIGVRYKVSKNKYINNVEYIVNDSYVTMEEYNLINNGNNPHIKMLINDDENNDIELFSISNESTIQSLSIIHNTELFIKQYNNIKNISVDSYGRIFEINSDNTYERMTNFYISDDNNVVKEYKQNSLLNIKGFEGHINTKFKDDEIIELKLTDTTVFNNLSNDTEIRIIDLQIYTYDTLNLYQNTIYLLRNNTYIFNQSNKEFQDNSPINISTNPISITDYTNNVIFYHTTNNTEIQTTKQEYIDKFSTTLYSEQKITFTPDDTTPDYLYIYSMKSPSIIGKLVLIIRNEIQEFTNIKSLTIDRYGRIQDIGGDYGKADNNVTFEFIIEGYSILSELEQNNFKYVLGRDFGIGTSHFNITSITKFTTYSCIISIIIELVDDTIANNVKSIVENIYNSGIAKTSLTVELKNNGLNNIDSIKVNSLPVIYISDPEAISTSFNISGNIGNNIIVNDKDVLNILGDNENILVNTYDTIKSIHLNLTETGVISGNNETELYTGNIDEILVDKYGRIKSITTGGSTTLPDSGVLQSGASSKIFTNHIKSITINSKGIITNITNSNIDIETKLEEEYNRAVNVEGNLTFTEGLVATDLTNVSNVLYGMIKTINDNITDLEREDNDLQDNIDVNSQDIDNNETAIINNRKGLLNIIGLDTSLILNGETITDPVLDSLLNTINKDSVITSINELYDRINRLAILINNNTMNIIEDYNVDILKTTGDKILTTSINEIYDMSVSALLMAGISSDEFSALPFTEGEIVLNSLNTTYKSDLIGAINELHNEINDLGDMVLLNGKSVVESIVGLNGSVNEIGDLSALKTESKDTLINSINYVYIIANNNKDSITTINADLNIIGNLTNYSSDLGKTVTENLGNLTNVPYTVEEGIFVKLGSLSEYDVTNTLLNNLYTKTDIDDKFSALVDGAPKALDTLKELANALSDDSSYDTTIRNLINQKENIINGAASTITSNDLDPLRMLISSVEGKVIVSSISTDEITKIRLLEDMGADETSVKTQIGNKQDIITGAASTIVTNDLDESRVVITDGSGKISVSTIITDNMLNCLQDIRSNIQTQIDGISGFESITLSSNEILITDDAGAISGSGTSKDLLTDLNNLSSNLLKKQDKLNADNINITAGDCTVNNLNIAANGCIKYNNADIFDFSISEVTTLMSQSEIRMFVNNTSVIKFNDEEIRAYSNIILDSGKSLIADNIYTKTDINNIFSNYSSTTSITGLLNEKQNILDSSSEGDITISGIQLNNNQILHPEGNGFFAMRLTTNQTIINGREQLTLRCGNHNKMEIFNDTIRLRLGIENLDLHVADDEDLSTVLPLEIRNQYRDINITGNLTANNLYTTTEIDELLDNKEDTITLFSYKCVITNAEGKLETSATITPTMLDQLSSLERTLSNIDDSITNLNNTSAFNLKANIVLVTNSDSEMISSSIATEKLAYISDVTSPLQEQLNSKLDIFDPPLTSATVLVTDYDGNIIASPDNITSTKLSYLSDISENIGNLLSKKIDKPISSSLKPGKVIVAGDNDTITTDNIEVDYLELNCLERIDTNIKDALDSKWTLPNDTIIRNNTVLIVNTHGNIISSDYVTSTQLEYLSDVNGNIGALINAKYTLPGLDADKVILSNGSGNNIITHDQVTYGILSYLSGVTGPIQSQLNNKVSIPTTNFEDNTVIISSGADNITSSTITATELGYLYQAKSNIQFQIDALTNSSGSTNTDPYMFLSSDYILLSYQDVNNTNPVIKNNGIHIDDQLKSWAIGNTYKNVTHTGDWKLMFKQYFDTIDYSSDRFRVYFNKSIDNPGWTPGGMGGQFETEELYLRNNEKPIDSGVSFENATAVPSDLFYDGVTLYFEFEHNSTSKEIHVNIYGSDKVLKYSITVTNIFYDIDNEIVISFYYNRMTGIISNVLYTSDTTITLSTLTTIDDLNSYYKRFLYSKFFIDSKFMYFLQYMDFYLSLEENGTFYKYIADNNKKYETFVIAHNRATGREVYNDFSEVVTPSVLYNDKSYYSTYNGITWFQPGRSSGQDWNHFYKVSPIIKLNSTNYNENGFTVIVYNTNFVYGAPVNVGNTLTFYIDDSVNKTLFRYKIFMYTITFHTQLQVSSNYGSSNASVNEPRYSYSDSNEWLYAETGNICQEYSDEIFMMTFTIKPNTVNDSTFDVTYNDYTSKTQFFYKRDGLENLNVSPPWNTTFTGLNAEWNAKGLSKMYTDNLWIAPGVISEEHTSTEYPADGLTKTAFLKGQFDDSVNSHGGGDYGELIVFNKALSYKELNEFSKFHVTDVKNYMR